MTEVWILIRDWGYEGKEVVEVYASEEKAKAAKDVIDKLRDTTVSYEKWEVK